MNSKKLGQIKFFFSRTQIFSVKYKFNTKCAKSEHNTCAHLAFGLRSRTRYDTWNFRTLLKDTSLAQLTEMGWKASGEQKTATGIPAHIPIASVELSSWSAQM